MVTSGWTQGQPPPLPGPPCPVSPRLALPPMPVAQAQEGVACPVQMQMQVGGSLATHGNEASVLASGARGSW